MWKAAVVGSTCKSYSSKTTESNLAECRQRCLAATCALLCDNLRGHTVARKQQWLLDLHGREQRKRGQQLHLPARGDRATSVAQCSLCDKNFYGDRSLRNGQPTVCTDCRTGRQQQPPFVGSDDSDDCNVCTIGYTKTAAGTCVKPVNCGNFQELVNGACACNPRYYAGHEVPPKQRRLGIRGWRGRDAAGGADCSTRDGLSVWLVRFTAVVLGAHRVHSQVLAHGRADLRPAEQREPDVHWTGYQLLLLRDRDGLRHIQ